MLGRHLQFPTALCSHTIDHTLAPSRGRTGERAKLRRLVVPETSNHQPRVDDALTADLLPLEDPAGVNHVVGKGLRHAFEGLEVVPALKFVHHGPVACGLLLTNFVDREDVVLPLDDGPLESRGTELDDIVAPFLERWKVHRVVWDQEHAHCSGELNLQHRGRR